MRKLFKYELEPIGEQSIKMPKGSQVLSVIEQYGKIIVYAMVDVNEEEADRDFVVLGTGWAVPQIIDKCTFIGTVKVGQYVWHVWEARHRFGLRVLES